MKLGEAHIIQGNALDLPLPDNSVDLVCTSPPYFGLRSYQDDGKHYEGQIGSEATPAEFLDALIVATREMVRVLKPTGSIFVNLGDKYSGGTSGGRNKDFNQRWHGDGNSGKKAQEQSQTATPAVRGFPPKTLLGIPWRYAIRCIDELGLILRAEIIWAKPNGLPESVTDRVRRSHEQWFHMVKQPRYFAAVDEIREAQLKTGGTAPDGRYQNTDSHSGTTHRAYQPNAHYNPLGKLPGSVWTIPTQPLTVPPELGIDHFAAYPMEWPRRIIQGWTPNGVCTVCGQGRRPVKGTDWDKIPHQIVEKQIRTDEDRARYGALFRDWQDAHDIPTRDLARLFPSATGGITGCVHNWRNGMNALTEDQQETITARYGPLPDELRSFQTTPVLVPVANREMRNAEQAGRNRATGGGLGVGVISITGYMCGCADATAPTTPSVVLDPFGGTGTTALVAKALGRTGISVDLSHDYCRMAVWRTDDPGELASALQVEKPEPVPDGQVALF